MATAFATLASAHDHHNKHHHGGGFSLWVAPNGKSTSDNLKECLCWDSTTNSWCQDSNDGNHKGFWRDSCARVVYANTWWWIPVVIWLLYLIVLPLCMVAFRLCCNCCGGRTPSYGCCCPISNGVLSPDPKWVRPYSRCATWTAKILALLLASAFISLSVHTLISNSDVTRDIHSAVPQLQNWLQGDMGQLSLAAQTQYKWIKSTDLAALEKVQTFAPTLQTIQQDLGDVNANDNRYRHTPVKVLVGLVLALTIFVTLLGLCNVRSWPISISAGILCLVTFCIVLWASTIGTVSAAMDLYCDNRAEVEKFAVDAISGNGYCNVSGVSNAVNNTQIDFVKHLCQERGMAKALTPIAKNKQGLTICDVAIGGMLVDSPVMVEPFPLNLYNLPRAGRVNWQLLGRVFSNKTLAAITDSKDDKVYSLYDCSVYSNCSQHEAWKNYYAELGFVYNGLNYVDLQNRDCNWVKRTLYTVVDPLLCGTNTINSVRIDLRSPTLLAHNTRRLAGLLFGLALFATIGFWVWMNGSKRFTKAASREELLGHHEMHRRTFDHLSYDYMQNSSNQQPQQGYTIAQPVPAAAAPRTQAVAGTTQQPLLLDHSGQNYGASTAPVAVAADPQGSVNNRPVKEQPEEVV